MECRNPTASELMLLQFLIREAGMPLPSEELLEGLKVSEMDDGGMGSLRLFQKNATFQTAELGKAASTCYFKDTDRVEVIATLNIDTNGNLYELDIWKTDFGRLSRIPSLASELHRENE